MKFRRGMIVVGSAVVACVLGGCGASQHSPTDYAHSAYLRAEAAEQQRFAQGGSLGTTYVRRGVTQGGQTLAAGDGLGRTTFTSPEYVETTPVRTNAGPTAITGVDPQ
jgi:hypothetical protein